MGIYIIFIVVLLIMLHNIVKRLHRKAVGLLLGVSVGLLHFIMLPLGASLIYGVPLPGLPTIGGLQSIYPLQMPYETIMVLGSVGIIGVLDLLVMIPRLPAVQSVYDYESDGYYASISNRAIQLLVVLAIILHATAFYVSGLAQGGHWAHSSNEFMHDYGVWAQILYMARFAVQMAALIAILLSLVDKTISLVSAVMYMLLLAGFQMFTTGNRIFALYVASGFAVCLWINRRYVILGMLFVGSIPFGWLMTLYVIMRAYMHAANSSLASNIQRGWSAALENSFQRNIIVEYIYSITEATDLTAAMNVVRDFPGRHHLLYGATLLKPFVFWIPRFVWADKPVSSSVYLARFYAPSLQGFSLNGTVIGEMFMNFSWLSLFIFPVLICLAGWLMSRWIPNPRLRGLVGFLFGISIMRGNISDQAMYFAIGLILLYMVGRRSTQVSRGNLIEMNSRIKH
ncbi:MAG: hypothetical protein IT446_13895 [Phycisphaerales bacterium]|nr:hypothetical protein [Phycisphaerales bacterium]